MGISTSQTGGADLILYAGVALTILNFVWTISQFILTRQARRADLRAKEAETHKTETEADRAVSERNSINATMFNTLLKTINEQIEQFIKLRESSEEQRLKDHEAIGVLRTGLGECQDAYEKSERERARLAHELQEEKDRLAQLEELIREGRGASDKRTTP